MPAPSCSICNRVMRRVRVPYERPFFKHFNSHTLQPKGDIETYFAWCCNGDPDVYGQGHAPNFAEYNELDRNEDFSKHPAWLQQWFIKEGLDTPEKQPDRVRAAYPDPEKPNQIHFDYGTIVIQSCDDKTAHIGVFRNKPGKGQNAYHHVSLPDLVRDWRLTHADEMPVHEYDLILRRHKAVILQTIADLNTISA